MIVGEKHMKKKTIDVSKIRNSDIILQNAEILLTQKCNLHCDHCLRGDATNKTITRDVLDAFFDNIFYIQNLSLGGGEISLEPELIRMVTASLKSSKIIGVGRVNMTTNGTNVTDEFVDALRELTDYVKQGFDEDDMDDLVLIGCSIDDFHLAELQKRGYSVEDITNNLAKIKKAIPEAYVDFRQECDVDLIDIGRAKDLVGVKKVRPALDILTPFYHDEKKNRTYLGGIPCLSTDGEIIPINIPFADEKTMSYGSVLHHDFIDILSKMRLKEKQKSTDIDKAYIRFAKSMSASEKLWKKYNKEYGYKKSYIFEKSLEESMQSEK